MQQNDIAKNEKSKERLERDEKVKLIIGNDKFNTLDPFLFKRYFYSTTPNNIFKEKLENYYVREDTP